MIFQAAWMDSANHKACEPQIRHPGLQI